MTPNIFIGTVSGSACCVPNVVLRLKWTHKLNQHRLTAFLIGRSKSFTEDTKIPGIYGVSSKGSKATKFRQGRFRLGFRGNGRDRLN